MKDLVAAGVAGVVVLGGVMFASVDSISAARNEGAAEPQAQNAAISVPQPAGERLTAEEQAERDRIRQLAAEQAERNRADIAAERAGAPEPEPAEVCGPDECWPADQVPEDAYLGGDPDGVPAAGCDALPLPDRPAACFDNNHLLDADEMAQEVFWGSYNTVCSIYYSNGGNSAPVYYAVLSSPINWGQTFASPDTVARNVADLTWQNC